MVDLNVQLDVAELVEKFDKLRGKIKSQKPVMEQGAVLLRREFQHTFAVEGPGWPKNARGTKTLFKTGTLLNSFINPNGLGHVEKVGDNFAEVGSNIPYAHLHDKGAKFINEKIKKKSGLQKMPKRQIARDVSDSFLTKISKYAMEHFEGAFR